MKPLIFIIEDDRKLNEIFSLSLKSDFDIETCMDGKTALERLKFVKPDIMVLDLNLPGTSGANILTYVRGDDRLKNVRVILTTADERQAETLNNTADIVLLKPVNPTMLKEMALRLSG